MSAIGSGNIGTKVGGGGGEEILPDIPVWVATGTKMLQTYDTSGVNYIPIVTTDTLRLQCRIDYAGTYTLKINYAMSAADTGDVKLQCDYIAIDSGGNPNASLGSATPTDDEFTPGNVTTMLQHEVFTFTVTAGEQLLILLTRVAPDGTDHSGMFNYLDAVLVPAEAVAGPDGMTQVAGAYTITNSSGGLRSLDENTGTPQQLVRLITTLLQDLEDSGYFTNVTIT